MRFRWEWILVPLMCLVMAWILSVATCSFEWPDITDALHVRSGEYGKLAILGLLLIAIVAIVRVFRGGGQNDA